MDLVLKTENGTPRLIDTGSKNLSDNSVSEKPNVEPESCEINIGR